MTAEPPCCQGLPQHTYGDDCLHHREESCDISTEHGVNALVRKSLDDYWKNGGVLRPRITSVRLGPGEKVLSREDVRRLLEGEES